MTEGYKLVEPPWRVELDGRAGTVVYMGPSDWGFCFNIHFDDMAHPEAWTKISSSEDLNRLKRLAAAPEPLRLLAEEQGVSPSRDHDLAAGSALDGWRPIETVPSSYTKEPISRWVDWLLLGRYDDHGWVEWVGGMDADEWLDRDSERCCGASLTPTHWQPLPQPPVHETEGDKSRDAIKPSQSGRPETGGG